MQVYEGSTLTFDVPGVFSDLEYDLVRNFVKDNFLLWIFNLHASNQVLRYEHAQNFPNEWSSGKVELERADGLPPQSEKCRNAPVSYYLLKNYLGIKTELD
jgi:hypothetical protein